MQPPGAEHPPSPHPPPWHHCFWNLVCLCRGSEMYEEFVMLLQSPWTGGHRTDLAIWLHGIRTVSLFCLTQIALLSVCTIILWLDGSMCDSIHFHAGVICVKSFCFLTFFSAVCIASRLAQCLRTAPLPPYNQPLSGFPIPPNPTPLYPQTFPC